ncbi:hypothetical protein [Amycolatopsis jiangsuensis]|uniref:Mce-associated membrane protein n=1 Tax=Amycolatopsis jiangsuensis TaxID=1181879 RepID=A0A840IZ60_9PSEU|nr:hypothetical protein [Amycolatopsis jiangsuensis]MBB4686492.1 Mce-associated membrane protein [Amycolatopsis jiangsuensis]
MDPTEVTQEIRLTGDPRARRAEPVSPPVTESPAGPEAGETAEATTGVEEAEAGETVDAAEASETAEASEVDALTGETVEKPSAGFRPSPRRKQRDTGRAKPADVDEAETRARAEAGAEDDSPRESAASRTKVYACVLLIVGLVLAAAAVIFNIQYQNVSASTSNTALLDVAKTAQVKDAVSKATESLFSYDYNNIKKTEDAANTLLANDEVKNRYNALMGQVKKLAPQQKMVVTCKVSRAAVIRIDGDLARVMVFVDQTSTRADTKDTAAGTAQLHVDAQLQGDTWKITDLDTYKAAQAPGAASPSAPASSGAASSPAAPPSK